MRWILCDSRGSRGTRADRCASSAPMLPKAHTASRTARVALPPDALYALLSDVDRIPVVAARRESLQRLPDRDGKPAWIEDDGGHEDPDGASSGWSGPSLLVARIDSDDLPFGGTWTYRIAPAAAGSELTITEDGEVSNVIFRFMSKLRLRPRMRRWTRF